VACVILAVGRSVSAITLHLQRTVGLQPQRRRDVVVAAVKQRLRRLTGQLRLRWLDLRHLDVFEGFQRRSQIAVRGL
jgi:hypothetical protein